jgi:hypothetical protein
VRSKDHEIAEAFRTMGLPESPVPKTVSPHRLHKQQSGQAIVTLTDDLGHRRDVLLGKHITLGRFAECKRVVSEWEVNGGRRPAAGDADDAVTVFLRIGRSVKIGNSVAMEGQSNMLRIPLKIVRLNEICKTAINR